MMMVYYLVPSQVTFHGSVVNMGVFLVLALNVDRFRDIVVAWVIVKDTLILSFFHMVT